MRHHVIALLTTHHETVAKKLGEFFGTRTSDSDLVFYNGVSEEDVFIIVIPKGYPDKLKSLLQAMAIGDVHVLLVTPDQPFDALLGEMIVALECRPDAMPAIAIGGVTKMNEYLVDDMRAKLAKVIANTSLKDRIGDVLVIKDEVGMQAFKEHVMALSARVPSRRDEPARVIVDASFPVRGIGTVILGVVKAGRFNAGDMLEMTEPVGPSRNVIVKSIQIQDIDQKEAVQGDRVGLAIKGLKPEEITRDNVLVQKGSVASLGSVVIDFTLSKFAKKPVDLAEKQVYHVAIEHQVHAASPVKIEGTRTSNVLAPGERGTVTFKPEKSLAVSPRNARAIVGILEKFGGKLRILGSGTVMNA